MMLFAQILSSSGQGFFFKQKKLDQTLDTACPIESIEPIDDAFHGIQGYLSNEWWYFDAVFGNGYQIHIGIRVISLGDKWAIVNQIINIYNNSVIEYELFEMEPIDNFFISREYPCIYKNGNSILTFRYNDYNHTGIWNYTITLHIDPVLVNLTFIQKTQGFKYITANEGWTVAQPKATVYGSLVIDEHVIPVVGIGYHDHNWNFSLSTALRSRGWYWGKISSANYTLTWAKILKMPFTTEEFVDNIGILSTLDDGFEYILPENIRFSADEKVFLNGRFIPTEFHLNIDQDDTIVNVTFQAVSIQQAPPDFFTINYWRYFVLISGYIQNNGKRDYIDDSLQIIEFIRFI